VSAYSSALRSTVRVDWSQVEVLGALRCTVGVAVPLLVGLLSNHPTITAFGAVGAVSVGFGSFQGAYRSQATGMVLASLAMAIAVFVGSIAGASNVAVTVVTTLVALGGGLLIALGPAGAFIGLQAMVAVVIAGGFASDPTEAAIRAAAVLGGGLLQTALVAVIWPFRRFGHERRAVAVVYRTLAHYATTLASDSPSAPEPHTLAATPSPVVDPQPFARAAEVLVFVALLDEAERIRAGLAAVALRHGPLLRTDRACAAAFASATSALLNETAAAIEEGRAPRDVRSLWTALETCSRAFTGEPAFEAVLGRLRAAWRTATSLATDDMAAADAPALPQPRRLPVFRDALITLRANLSLESSAFRHALRLAVTVGLATAAYRASGLERGYWIAMTALIVLRPEFQDTIARGIARIAGTLAGAALATIIFWLFAPGHGAQMILLLVFVYACYSLFRINYAVFAACLTAYVVFLLMLSGIGEMTAATMRALYTMAGGMLALVAYAVWPTWAGRSAKAALATMLDAHRAYVRALFDAYDNPATYDADRVGGLRSAARLARSNAEAVIERMLDEPISRRAMSARRALGLLAALRRHALAALALHSGLEQASIAAVPGLGLLRSQIDTSLAMITDALRHNRAPDALPPLRQTERALPAEAVARIGAEADAMVDAIKSMADLLAP
jgi:hypothetical protein